MDTIGQFVFEHWMLWLLFFTILAMIVWFENRTSIGGVTKVIPQQLVQLINHQQALVLDIRDSVVFEKAHIVNAVNIPANDIDRKQNKLQRFKQKSVVVVCERGQQAMPVALKLKQFGFNDVYLLNGGLAAWKEASMPLEGC